MFEVSKNYVHRKIVDEFILVPIKASLRQKNNLIVLNPIAATIYEKIAEKKSISIIKNEILEEFDATESQIENDFEQFTKELIELEAIHAVD